MTVWTREMLQEFCDPGRNRLEEPWRDDGHCFASDACVAIRVCGAVRGVTRPGRVHVDGFFAALDALECDWVSCRIDGPLWTVEGSCRHCIGGRMLACMECGGEGYRHCDMGHEHACVACCGRGRRKLRGGDMPCEDCDGTGEVRRVARAGWCGQAFDAVKVGRLLALPGAELARELIGVRHVVAMCARGDGWSAVQASLHSMEPDRQIEVVG